MPKYIISGGGTGGHIFPAISIANALKERQADADILFVGAEGRMEMERVPQAGYPIRGLPISGLDRRNILKNIKVLFNLQKSISLARKIVKDFQPDAVVGVGGYASAPTLRAAAAMNIPTFIQEQNSYAGIANKLLAKKARAICVAYDEMERFFPAEKIVKTGNPVRQNLFSVTPKAAEAFEFFGFSPEKKTLLVVGGSLGARTINESVTNSLSRLLASGIQIIWQTGKYYYENAQEAAGEFRDNTNLIITDFVARMDFAYSVADLVISRAGASSISELCLLAKPTILVPSPNVAEDHQTKNALALVKHEAATLVTDEKARQQLIENALELIFDNKKLLLLAENIAKLAEQNSAQRIADVIISGI
ncbi:MAG: undecaprenyldiphospho-muramoylpentapeptide beta-N-acetylglucosaminyltransferase [Prevotellaceae bacterium]|jgi:UDP-N-acetylglucosamine--N-acetylmuramyl-(pentapeptide) pyrophosphoryl-undecaprenol N-acetylglucosamine transferase|nr:undecaprenyldiphospho-muramoylpentapeptide beta-N-acetylglucosaminyltransferase [Prevotellaceae bacterium]